MRKLLAYILFITLSISSPDLLQAQIGGYGIYKFMNLPPSSRTAALGGNLISVKDNDLSLAIQNPSLLNAEMSNRLSFSYIDYLSDINFGSFAYARQLDSLYTGIIGIQYINYGSFIAADVSGNQMGTFSGGDYNLFTGVSRDMGKFSVGSQLKLILSNLAGYHSFGAAIDLSATYVDTSKGLTMAVIFKNIGYQFKPYMETRENLPFEIQTGISIKPKHMPLRISIIAHDLQRWNFRYLNTNQATKIDFATGEEIITKMPFSEEIARHFIFGGELLITKNFNLRFGYNHQRRKEMTIEDRRGFVGFSYGVGFRISKFNVSYGRSSFSLAGASNTFTIQTSLGEFFRKEQ